MGSNKYYNLRKNSNIKQLIFKLSQTYNLNS